MQQLQAPTAVYRKFFVAQLQQSARPSAERKGAFDCAGQRGFLRVWLQGVVVANNVVAADGSSGSWLLDDGTGIARIVDAQQPQPPVGSYAMALGRVAIVASSSSSALPDVVVKRHKHVDLTAQPNREALWAIEVAEAQL